MCEKWINCLAFVPFGVCVCMNVDLNMWCMYVRMNGCGWSIQGNKQKACFSRQTHAHIHTHSQYSMALCNMMVLCSCWMFLYTYANKCECSTMYVHTLIFSILWYSWKLLTSFRIYRWKNWCQLHSEATLCCCCYSVCCRAKVKSKILR